MTEHIYILTIDANGSSEDLGKIQQYVTTSSDFSSWWNHLPMVFMLDSALTADTLGEKLHELTPNARFLLTKANLTESQGWLPEASWKWIEKRALSQTPQQSPRF